MTEGDEVRDHGMKNYVKTIASSLAKEMQHKSYKEIHMKDQNLALDHSNSSTFLASGSPERSNNNAFRDFSELEPVGVYTSK